MKILVAFFSHALFSLVVGLAAAALLGPEQFGRFALGLAGAGFVQILAFDWLRLSATRFYSQSVREQRPQMRAVLNAGFAWAAGVIAGVGALAIALLAPDDLRALALAALAMTVLNGLFDFYAALARARFLDDVYVRLILVKNLASLALVIGAAYYTQSAAATLFAAAGALTISLVAARRALRDPPVRQRELAREDVQAIVRDCARYCTPIVLAAALYLAVPLLDRLWVAHRWGYAQSGYFSLAFDIGWRVLAAFGAALDVLLFQIAVRASQKGATHARVQVARNFGVVFAVLAPAALGLWLVAPGLQSVFAPAAFHGPFLEFFTLLLPGFFCLALASFGAQARFQIETKTAPLLVAALVAFAVNAIALGAPAPNYVGTAQSLAFACALAILLLWRGPGALMSAADFSKVAAATLLMGLVLWPLRSMEPGVAALAAQVAIGLAIYGACVAAFDIAGLRTMFAQALKAALRA
jgi:O-antigen/teichoic acid export membrane protein